MGPMTIEYAVVFRGTKTHITTKGTKNTKEGKKRERGMNPNHESLESHECDFH